MPNFFAESKSKSFRRWPDFFAESKSRAVEGCQTDVNGRCKGARRQNLCSWGIAAAARWNAAVVCGFSLTSFMPS